MAESVDALASGASVLWDVEVQVLFWAPWLALLGGLLCLGGWVTRHPPLFHGLLFHGLEVELPPLTNAAGPARRDRLGAGVKPKRVRTMLVEIPKGGFLPPPKGVIG